MPKATRRTPFLWATLFLLMLAGCRPVAPSAHAPALVALAPDPQAIAQGRQLYHTLACDSCHGLDAVGSTRTYAPTHNHLRATAEQRIHAADYSGTAQTAAGYIRESIVTPKAYIVAGYAHIRFGMPSFAHLSEREIDALVQFLYAQE